MRDPGVRDIMDVLLLILAMGTSKWEEFSRKMPKVQGISKPH